MSVEQSHPREIADVLAKAATDGAFRQSLVNDADAALRQAGIALSSGARIRFIERPQDVDALVVLPDLRSAQELSVEELEAVAGGTSYDCPPDTSGPCRSSSCTTGCNPPE